MPPQPNTGAELARLSLHYDALLWRVITTWAIAIVALLVYCTHRFDLWLSFLGQGLTLAAAIFTAQFHDARRRVIARMADPAFRDIHSAQVRFHYSPLFLLLFLVLIALWTRLQIIHTQDNFNLLWLVIAIFIAMAITATWFRDDTEPAADAPPATDAPPPGEEPHHQSEP